NGDSGVSGVEHILASVEYILALVVYQWLIGYLLACSSSW
ncbi:hypothetical protein A2U01_0100810, partial [Trifolium medium]|nr:hypothetical protein [Trifolium medium]